MRLRIATLAALAAALVLVPVGPGGTQTTIPETVSARIASLPAASASQAAGATVAATPAAGRSALSAPVEAPIPFSMVGLELPEGAEALVRTSTDGRTWAPWQEAEVYEGDDGPDPGTAEQRGARDHGRFAEPIWVSQARYLQVSVDGAQPTDVAATFIDSMGLGRSGARKVVDAAAATFGGGHQSAHAQGTSRPNIVTRAGWGADESLRKGTITYATPRYAVVHHTVTGNGYTAAEAPGIVRGIYHYHTKTLGWNDVGYNFLVDRFGRIYEGRAGGITRGVAGAHAQGFNTGSFGVALLGTFENVAPPAAGLSATADIVSWKMALHGINPKATIEVTSGGSNKYPAGTKVRLPTTTGHRDIGQTACPGARYYAQLPNLRTTVADRYDTWDVSPFSDVKGSVHLDSILRLYEGNIANACEGDRFCPDVAITRAQIATWLARAMKLTDPGSRSFTDVPSGHPSAGDIEAVHKAGFMNGYSDGSFGPAQALPRDQMASVLRRATGLEHVWGSRFSDVQFESPHRSSINALHQAGITQGCSPERFCPGREVSRGQMASFTARAILDRVGATEQPASSEEQEAEAEAAQPAGGPDPEAGSDTEG